MADAANIEGVFINLDRATERRAAIEAQLRDIRPPYPMRRFAAIDGSRRGDAPANLLPGQYGCWLSHVATLDQALASDRHLHVMEDDAVLGRKMTVVPEAVGMLASGAGVAWDLLYLDATLVEIADMLQMFEWTQEARRKNIVQVQRIPAQFTVYGTHSYVVNSSRKKYVRDFLRSHLEAGVPIDNVLAGGIQSGQLNAYVTAPYLTSGGDSGLESTVGGGVGFLAWLLFRRLCFSDLSEEAAEKLEARVGELTRSVPRPEAIFGALCAYRVATWPNTSFTPVKPG